MHRDEVRHILRTPLTVVKGVLRLLEVPRVTPLPEKLKVELIQRANAQVETLERAIEGVELHFPDSEEYDVIVLHEEIVDLGS
ncbi:MAG: hypothetical protein ACLGIB_13125 [Actinomycetota bacterium]